MLFCFEGIFAALKDEVVNGNKKLGKLVRFGLGVNGNETWTAVSRCRLGELLGTVKNFEYVVLKRNKKLGRLARMGLGVNCNETRAAVAQCRIGELGTFRWALGRMLVEVSSLLVLRLGN